MNLIDILSYGYLFCYFLLIFVALVFVISGIDDFFVFIVYLVRAAYRKFYVFRRYNPFTEEQLHEPDEKYVAIFIPCWDESAVIKRMLENTLETLMYKNYYIFVGTYPNDPDTSLEVEKIREDYSNVHKVVCPKDGPTNKADCLNWTYQGALNFEKDNNIKFDIFVIHDSEDIVHPLSLKFFNYLIPNKNIDMVQLPVLPLMKKWYEFTANHYADEFVENHAKDLVAREFLGRTIPIPSAGVGCAFSRKALEVTREKNNNQVFNLDSLTEDYELGVRLNDYGLRAIFAFQSVERIKTVESFWTGKQKEKKYKEYIATKGFFPSKFWLSVRQKTRWMIGITLQAWESMGWRGDFKTKYILARDRKSLLTNIVNFLGYIVVFAILLYWLIGWLYPDAYRFPPLVNRGTYLWYLIIIATFFLIFQLIIKAYYVYIFYNFTHAILSIPRRVWANIINFVATIRAIKQYVNYQLTGELIKWDKTGHAFPSEEFLRSFRRKFGEMLLEKRFITVQQLDEALRKQKELKKPLGEILIELGYIERYKMQQVLEEQLNA